jgi:hypothetical protein
MPFEQGLSNGHSRQIRQNGELLVRMCRMRRHILANVGLANVGRMCLVRGKWLANVGRMCRVQGKWLANVGEFSEFLS